MKAYSLKSVAGQCIEGEFSAREKKFWVKITRIRITTV